MINKKEFIKNNFYSLGGKIINLIVTMGGMAILARLLTPEDFGIYAIILGVQAFFQPILDMGLGSVYIKKDKITNEFKNAFFSINIFLGLINIIFLMIAIFILNYLYNINFTQFILIFLLSIIFTSLSLIYSFELLREKNFRLMFIGTLLANIGSLCFSVFAALSGLGIWSLIIKAVTYSLILFLFYFFLMKFTYKIIYWKKILNYIDDLKFGLSIFFNRIINGVFNSFDKVILGKFFGIDILGNYNNARQLSIMPDSIIRTSLTSVVYSYLERLDIENRRKSYAKYYSIVFVFSSILPIILFFWGDYLVLLLLGEQWVKASQYIQILSIFSLGMIMKGIVTMIGMHEKKMKMLNLYTIIIMLIVIGGIFIMAMSKIDIKYILYFMSLFMLISWLFILIIQIRKMKCL